MLNEPLYKAVSVLFNEQPGIVNEGVPAAIHFPPPVASIVPTVTRINARDVSGGEQYTVNCPFCGDTRHRLYISATWNAKIEIAGQTYVCSDRLIRCFNEECQKVQSNRDWIVNGLNKLLKDAPALDSMKLVEPQNSSEAASDSLSNQVPLPPNMADIEHPSVPQYIRDYWYTVRGFSADTLRKYGVKIAYLPYPIKRGCTMLQQPVTIIPVYQYGNYWFFQARLIPIDGDPKKGYERNFINDEYPKYFIPHGVKKSWTLYNLDNASKYEDVAIVEGVTDVWRIGKAVAKFGRSLSIAQRGVLVKVFRNKNILLVPDMDDPLAYEESCKDAVLLRNTGAFKSVKIAVLEKGVDPGDLRLNEEEMWNYLQSRLSSQGEPSSETCGLQDIL